jgi:hypothetical protein
MLLDDIRQDAGDGIGLGYIGEVCCDSWSPEHARLLSHGELGTIVLFGVGIFPFEIGHQLFRLMLGLLHYVVVSNAIDQIGRLTRTNYLNPQWQDRLHLLPKLDSSRDQDLEHHL